LGLIFNSLIFIPFGNASQIGGAKRVPKKPGEHVDTAPSFAPISNAWFGADATRLI
jgi:hypothetical protein